VPAPPLAPPPPQSSATAKPQPDLRPGATIGDKYRVEREIGRGGFGVVLRARHLTLDQRVAIKVLTEGEGSTEAEFEEDAARFRLEARATAALKSEYVVRVLDVDVLPSGFPYIVMEYLEGKTLHELIYSQGPLPIDEAVDYVLQVLAALAEAHAVGIVHRDLKPANVLLTKGVGGAPKAKVLDFGVSKMAGGATQTLTRTGAVVGTVAYMAPEQMLDAKRVDGRADLWSAGLVLYEALARTHPWGSTTTGPRVVSAILNDALRPLRTVRPDVPPKLDLIVSRLLEKDAAKRYPTAAAVAKALTPFAPVRSRTVLDVIRRAPAPTGPAAAEGASVRRESKTPPPSPSQPRAKSSRGRRKTRASRTPWILLALVVFLLGAAAYLRWGPGVPANLRMLVTPDR
jgi:serine/threonine-protein kinase